MQGCRTAEHIGAYIYLIRKYIGYLLPSIFIAWLLTAALLKILSLGLEVLHPPNFKLGQQNLK